jgi:ribonuclease PH
MPKRKFNERRPLRITPHYLAHPEGSVLIECGDTRVICTASIEDRAPPWLKGTGRGWVTGEYDMLPRATTTRNQRDSHRGKLNGRTQEIGRLIGRALRASVSNWTGFGERTITVDCDVIQADGGTRTASITGGYIALALAFKNLTKRGLAKPDVLKTQIAAISAGIIEGSPYLDLDYNMDSNAHVDMNFVMTEQGEFVEIQGTGEGAAFARGQLNELLDLVLTALPGLLDLQKRAIATDIQSPLLTLEG